MQEVSAAYEQYKAECMSMLGNLFPADCTASESLATIQTKASQFIQVLIESNAFQLQGHVCQSNRKIVCNFVVVCRGCGYQSSYYLNHYRHSYLKIRDIIVINLLWTFKLLYYTVNTTIAVSKILRYRQTSCYFDLRITITFLHSKLTNKINFL